MLYCIISFSHGFCLHLLKNESIVVVLVNYQSENCSEHNCNNIYSVLINSGT